MKMEEKFTKRIDVQIFTGIIGLGLILVLIKSFLVNGPSKNYLQSNQDTLSIFSKDQMLLVSELNKNCPFMLDKETRFDNAMSLPNNTIQFNYTMVNCIKDTLNLDESRKSFEPYLLNGIKTSPDLKIFRDEKVTFNYDLRDKNGVFLFRITVSPDQYLTPDQDEPEVTEKHTGSVLGLPTIEEVNKKRAAKQVLSLPQKIVEAAMMKGVQEMNKNCPRLIDKGTRMENAILLSDNTFQINYTLINWEKDALDIEASKKLNEPNAINTVKNSSMIKFFRDNKVTVVYHYSDKHGVFLFETVVTPDMYLN